MCQLWALHVVTKQQFFTFIVKTDPVNASTTSGGRAFQAWMVLGSNAYLKVPTSGREH